MGKKITQLATITEVADDDLLIGVDISDTSGSDDGTNKKFTRASLLSGYALLDPQVSGWNPLEETLVYVSVDDPTGVVKVVGKDVTNKLSIGMRLMFTNGGNVIKAIITAIAFSADTTITFLHEIDPTDNQALTLMGNSAITLPYFSSQKAPYGFPIDPDKWTLKYEATALTVITDPVISQWYNLGTLNLPIGLWDVTYNAVIATTATGTAPNRCYITIGQNSASQGAAGCMTGMNTGATTAISLAPATNSKIFNLTNPGTIYLTFMTNQAANAMVDVYANGVATTIKAVCAYL